MSHNIKCDYEGLDCKNESIYFVRHENYAEIIFARCKEHRISYFEYGEREISREEFILTQVHES